MKTIALTLAALLLAASASAITVAVTISYEVDTSNTELLQDIRDWIELRKPAGEDENGDPITRSDAQYLALLKQEIATYGTSIVGRFKSFRKARIAAEQAEATPTNLWSDVTISVP